VGTLCVADRDLSPPYKSDPKPLAEEVRITMCLSILLQFRVPVVKNLVGQLRVNPEKLSATLPISRAAIPVVVWRCHFSIREIFKCAIAQRTKTVRASNIRSKIMPKLSMWWRRLAARGYCLPPILVQSQ
jgi:hypothetical protein